MARYARCIVLRYPDRMTAVLGRQIDVGYVADMQALSRNDCLEKFGLAFDAFVLRGALFKELWRRRVSAEAHRKHWQPVLNPINLEAAPVKDKEATANYSLLWFADCVVKADPVAASRFVLAPIASPEEKTSYRNIVGLLGPCWATGEPLRLNVPTLQGIMAEVLYRAPAYPSATEVKH